jgi:hypothetical protein
LAARDYRSNERGDVSKGGFKSCKAAKRKRQSTRLCWPENEVYVHPQTDLLLRQQHSGSHPSDSSVVRSGAVLLGSKDVVDGFGRVDVGSRGFLASAFAGGNTLFGIERAIVVFVIE